MRERRDIGAGRFRREKISTRTYKEKEISGRESQAQAEHTEPGPFREMRYRTKKPAKREKKKNWRGGRRKP